MIPRIQQHLARAAELLRAASELARLDLPSDSVSRSYYAIFHAATAVLLQLGIERSSHRGVWAAFGQFVAARGLIERRLHRAALELFADRLQSDYLPQPNDTLEDAQQNLVVAEGFVAACRSFLATRGE